MAFLEQVLRLGRPEGHTSPRCSPECQSMLLASSVLSWKKVWCEWLSFEGACAP